MKINIALLIILAILAGISKSSIEISINDRSIKIPTNILVAILVIFAVRVFIVVLQSQP